jgi:nitroimidazol reductase NimA-like FMN-containing flavoprotein (pyridoxamine 5'-phosphate oxidase superfamily)
MFGKLTIEQIEQLIKNQVVGRIGCHAGGVTYVVPISYAYYDNCIYAYSGKGMKIDFMKQNPNVCFQIDDTRDLTNWQSVICWGKFEEMSTPSQRKEALEKLNNRILPLLSSETMHITSDWPFADGGEKDRIGGVFYRIRLTDKTGRFEKSSDKYFFAT